MDNQENTPAANSEQKVKSNQGNGTIRTRLVGFGVLALIVAAGIGGFRYYEKNIGERYVHTDNAYTSAETAQITPVITGTIEQIMVKDTQYVRKGDLLLKLGSSDQILAMQEAQAQLGVVSRKVTGAMESDKQFSAQIGARDADIKSAEAKLKLVNTDLEKAKIEYDRRKNLQASGAVSADEVTSTKAAYDAALANMQLAKAQLEQASANKISAVGSRTSNAASFANASLGDNPEVLLAQTRLEIAQKDLKDTEVYAPISGVIAKRQVQIGQKVAAGMSMMEIVPVDQIYVDANFKESQLKHVHVGQSVELTSDLYGNKIVYRGKVSGISGGTGAAFSVIPTQNASGNWIKVIQRLPVRVEINQEDLKAHPLKIGLSMVVKIDTKSNEKK